MKLWNVRTIRGEPPVVPRGFFLYRITVTYLSVGYPFSFLLGRGSSGVPPWSSIWVLTRRVGKWCTFGVLRLPHTFSSSSLRKCHRGGPRVPYLVYLWFSFPDSSSLVKSSTNIWDPSSLSNIAIERKGTDVTP